MRRRSAGRGGGSPPPFSSEQLNDDHSPDGGTSAVPGGAEDGTTNGDPSGDHVPERRLNSGDSDEEGGGGMGNGSSRNDVTRTRDDVTRTLGMESDSEVESDGEELGLVSGSSVSISRKRRTRLGSGSSEDAPRSHDSSKRIRLGGDTSRGEDDESLPNDGTIRVSERQRVDGGSYGGELEQDRGQRDSSATLAGRRLRLDSDSSEEEHSIAAGTGRDERPSATVNLDSSGDNCSPPDRSSTHTAGNGNGSTEVNDLEGLFREEPDSDSEQELQIDINRDPEQDSNPALSEDDN